MTILTKSVDQRVVNITTKMTVQVLIAGSIIHQRFANHYANTTITSYNAIKLMNVFGIQSIKSAPPI